MSLIDILNGVITYKSIITVGEDYSGARKNRSDGNRNRSPCSGVLLVDLEVLLTPRRGNEFTK